MKNIFFHRLWKGMSIYMINFEEELKKFHPSTEIEDAEEMIQNQDLDDMSDIMIKLMKQSGSVINSRSKAGQSFAGKVK